MGEKTIQEKKNKNKNKRKERKLENGKDMSPTVSLCLGKPFCPFFFIFQNSQNGLKMI